MKGVVIMSLHKIKEFNISKSKLTLILLNLLGLGLFILSVPIFSKLAGLLMGLRFGQIPDEVQFTITGPDILVFLLTMVATLFIHELIHGLFFKAFAPDRPVKYGFHWYALSATSPGTKYSKGKFLWIGIAPFVFITLGLSGLFALGFLTIPSYIFLASMHTAGCIGDFYFCILLLLAPKGILVEDTGVGMVFYQETA